MLAYAISAVAVAGLAAFIWSPADKEKCMEGLFRAAALVFVAGSVGLVGMGVQYVLDGINDAHDRERRLRQAGSAAYDSDSSVTGQEAATAAEAVTAAEAAAKEAERAANDALKGI